MRDKEQQTSEAYWAARRRVQAKLGFYLHFAVFVAANIAPLVQAFNAVTLGHAYELSPYLVPIWLGWGIGLLLHQQTAFAGGVRSHKDGRSKPVSRIIVDKTRAVFDRMIENELKERSETRDFH